MVTGVIDLQKVMTKNISGGVEFRLGGPTGPALCDTRVRNEHGHSAQSDVFDHILIIPLKTAHRRRTGGGRESGAPIDNVGWKSPAGVSLTLSFFRSEARETTGDVAAA